MRITNFTNAELMEELKRRGIKIDSEQIFEDDLFTKSRAADSFSKLFDEYYPSEIEYISIKSEMFETYSPFKIPSIEDCDLNPSVLSIEQYHDPDNAPFVDVADYCRFTLYDQNGSVMAEGTTIAVVAMGDFEYWLEQLSDGFDLATANWSWFFQHPFFVNAPKDTLAIMFIESINVKKEYRGIGLGKWLMGVMSRYFIGLNTYGDLPNDRIAIGVIPFPDMEEPGDFSEKEALIINWYKHIFKCLQETDDFRPTKNFVLKEDVGKSDMSSILYWSAGGKKRLNS